MYECHNKIDQVSRARDGEADKRLSFNGYRSASKAHLKCLYFLRSTDSPRLVGESRIELTKRVNHCVPQFDVVFFAEDDAFLND
jgi:hypothetical protein